MQTYRDLMAEDGGNLSWCKPEVLSYRNRKTIVAINEGEVVGLSIDGKDVTDNLFVALIDHLGIVGANNIYDLRNYLWDGDEVGSEELNCRDCPWFNDCPAMDEQCG